MSSSLWKHFVVIIGTIFVMSGSAAAQVCGDANGDGQISLPDGVQALRAAADLQSNCTASRCDVDGDGDITVTDGVNVLRKVAQLPVTDQCPSDGPEGDVEALLQNTVPIVVLGNFTRGLAVAQAAGTENPCDNPEEGNAFLDENSFVFQNCNIDGANLDGSFDFGPNGDRLIFAITVVDLATGATFSFAGNLGATVDDAGMVTAAGRLDLSLSGLGAVSVVLENVVTDTDGNLVGGALQYDVSQAGIEGVTGVRIAFTPSTVVPVTVTFADQTTQAFELDTETFELTPVAAN
jgi:hypothetical protein